MGGGAEFVGSARRNFHEHVVGFRNADQDRLHHFQRLHRLPVGGNDGHRPTRIAEVKKGAGGAVDHAETHGFAGFCWECLFRFAIHEKRIVGHIGEIHRGHAHRLALEIFAELSGLRRSEHALGGFLFDPEVFRTAA